MIIDFMSGKGGTGKTTLALHVASVISQKYRVVLLDLDKQNSALSWFQYAQQNGNPPAFSVTSEKRGFKADVIIVDHPPSLDERPLSNLVVLPIQPSMFDVLAARRAAAMLHNVKIIDVLNRLNANRQEERDIAEQIAPAVIVKDRNIYKRTLSAGMTIASQEVANFYGAREAKQEIINLINKIGELK